MIRPRSVLQDSYRYAGVGLQFAATMAVFALLGWWGDGKLGSSPWLLLVGVFLGFGLGLYSIVSRLAPGDVTSASNSSSSEKNRPKS